MAHELYRSLILPNLSTSIGRSSKKMILKSIVAQIIQNNPQERELAAHLEATMGIHAR